MCRKLDLDNSDDVEDDEKDFIFDENPEKMGKNYAKPPREPIDEIKLDLIRLQRQKDIEMWGIIKELSSFACFVLVALALNYSYKDSNFYRFQDQLRYNFVTKNGFDQIQTSNDWWNWIHKTAVTELKAAAWYNGQPPYGLRGFIGMKFHEFMNF